MVNKKTWSVISIVVVTLIGVITFAISFRQVSHEHPSAPTIKSDLQTKEEFIGMVIKIPGVDINSYWELNVSKFESFDDTGHMFTVKGKYYLNKKPFYNISAASGIVYWKTRVLSLSGNVIMTTNDEKQLVAEQLTWDPNAKKIQARQNVVLTANRIKIETEEFKGNLDLERAVFSGFTKATYQR